MLEPLYLTSDVLNIVGLSPLAAIPMRLANALAPALTTLTNIGYANVVQNADGTYTRDFSKAGTETPFMSFPDIDYGRVPSDVITAAGRRLPEGVLQRPTRRRTRRTRSPFCCMRCPATAGRTAAHTESTWWTWRSAEQRSWWTARQRLRWTEPAGCPTDAGTDGLVGARRRAPGWSRWRPTSPTGADRGERRPPQRKRSPTRRTTPPRTVDRRTATEGRRRAGPVRATRPTARRRASRRPTTKRHPTACEAR